VLRHAAAYPVADKLEVDHSQTKMFCGRLVYQVRQMEEHRPVHRTIVVFDVEGFGGRQRTNRHQLAVRKGLYQIVADAFRHAGIPWDVSTGQDRGDGIFILLPPEVPKSLLVESLPAALVAELRTHNSVHRRQEQIRLRMALHAGEVSYDEFGVTAASVNLAFRLLDAGPLKSALAASPGVLAIIVSSWFFEEVVRHIEVDLASGYRPAAVTVKETTTTGWICLPDHPSPASEVVAADDLPGTVVGRARAAGSVTPVPLPARVPIAMAGLPANEGFAGRQDELFTLSALLAPSAVQIEPVLVSTIAGLAGVGKTALCVRAARQAIAAGWFPGGVLFVDLRGYDSAGYVEPGAAVEALLRALGVAGERIPPSLGERETLYRSELAAMAERGERVLVVADNASNLEQVLALRPGSPAHCMLVTSRHTLPVPGARRVEIDVLPEGESVAVVTQALRMARPSDDRIIAEPDAAAELVRLCGCLPLALRIAAELLADKPDQPVRDLVGILAEATERLDELAYGDSVGVRVAFDTSYRQLPADHALVFRRMGLHPGPQLSAAAAAALAGTSETAARRLADALRRAHLIQPAAVSGYYRLHDLLHLYALRCCQAEDEPAEREAAVDRLLAYYWETISAAATHLDPHVAAADRSSRFADRMDAVAWLESERPNLVSIVRLAADTGRDAYVRDIPLALIFFFYLRRHLDEWLSTGAAALAAARRIGDRNGEGRALSSLGNAYSEMRQWDTARDFFQQTLAVCVTEHDRSREARTLTNIGNIYYATSAFEECLIHYRQSLAIYQEIRESYSEGQTWNNIAYTYARMQRHEDAIVSYERSLAIFRDIEEIHGQAAVLTNLGTCYQALSRSVEALECHRQALAIFQQSGDQLREARALANLGETHQGMQHADEALACYHQALAIFREVADIYGEATTLASLASVHRDSLRADEALDHYQRALAVFVQANAAEDADQVRARIAELASAPSREQAS
jgi:tetratricopeptide (TPR) repeat protein